MKHLMTRLAVLLTFPLAACSGGASTAAPLPRFVTQPFYEAVLVDWALAYRDTLDGPLPFDLDTRTRSEGIDRIEEGDADLLLTSGEPPQDWFATPLGSVGLAVVVHPDNPVRDLSFGELHDLFSGLSDSWEDVGGRELPVQPVLPLPGEPLGEFFSSTVLGEAKPWPGTLMAPTTAAVAQIVEEDPRAVGMLPLAAVPETLRTVRVEGILPGETTVASGTYPLTVPLVATAPSEPGSPLRDFLVWIQSQARPAPTPAG